MLFKDQVEREQQALELNDAVLQGMVVAGMALDLGERKRGMEALDNSIAAASQMITELLGDDRGHLGKRPLRSSLPWSRATRGPREGEDRVSGAASTPNPCGCSSSTTPPTCAT